MTVITGSDHIAEKENSKTVSDDKHTTHVRGQCHLLLVGDPGTSYILFILIIFYSTLALSILG